MQCGVDHNLCIRLAMRSVSDPLNILDAGHREWDMKGPLKKRMWFQVYMVCILCWLHPRLISRLRVWDPLALCVLYLEAGREKSSHHGSSYSMPLYEPTNDCPGEETPLFRAAN